MKKQEIIESYQSPSFAGEGDIVQDSNHHVRRYFRCWIDGSYNGEGHYMRNCNFVRDNYTNDKRLRSLAISEWCDYIAHEHDCSVSTAQRATVEAFSTEKLERLNAELVDDMRDLVRDQMEAA